MKESIKNIPYIVVYILGFLLLLFAAVFYRQPLLSVLLILLFIMPPLSVAAMIYTASSLNISIAPDMSEYELPCEVNLILTVDNPGFIPLLNCRLFFGIENLYYPDRTDREILFPAEARTDKKINIPVKVRYSGMIRLNVIRLLISDPLHMYTKEIPIGEIYDIPVMPERVQVNELSGAKTQSIDEDVIWASDGELTMDRKQLREYRPGDKLRDVHWLLAAKGDDLPVKEYERGKELYYLLLPEMTEDSLQDTLTYFRSLALLLLQKGEIYRVAIYHAFEDVIDIQTVDSYEALRTVMYEMFKESTAPADSAYVRLNDMYPELSGVIRIQGRKIITV
jgi:uncharacterized protein (DUF58 family)